MHRQHRVSGGIRVHGERLLPWPIDHQHLRSGLPEDLRHQRRLCRKPNLLRWLVSVPEWHHHVQQRMRSVWHFNLQRHLLLGQYHLHRRRLLSALSELHQCVLRQWANLCEWRLYMQH